MKKEKIEGYKQMLREQLDDNLRSNAQAKVTILEEFVEILIG